MKIIRISILFMSLSLLFTGCTNKGQNFSDSEKSVITRNSENPIMRLYTVNNVDDSLILRDKATPLTEKMMRSRLFKKLCKRMLATVQDPENEGVGIAAPQVGISRQLIAVQRFDKEDRPFEFYANPRITFYSEQSATGKEGCLSVPDESGTVTRSYEIIVKYTDPVTLESKTEKILGFTAVIFQHEIDHLNGILYIDRQEVEASDNQE